MVDCKISQTLSLKKKILAAYFREEQKHGHTHFYVIHDSGDISRSWQGEIKKKMKLPEWHKVYFTDAAEFKLT